MSGNFCKKNPFFWFFIFLDDHLKKHYFYRVFWRFPFSFFLPFLFLYLQHKKGKNKKCNFLFENPHFWHSQNFAKTLFWHTVALFVFLKMPKKHYKTGEKTAKKNLDQFLTLDLDQFLTLETPNLGPVFNSTAYIYAVVFENGVLFLRFNRSIMLPSMRSIMGCAESGASNPYFYSVSGGEPRTSYSRGCVKYRAWSWGTMPKMRLFKAHFCSWYMASSSGLDRVWSRFFFCDVQKCPELREKWVFYIVGLKFATWRSKSGFRKKKGQNLFLVPHPSSFWCFSVSRLVFAKNGVSKIDEISLKPLKT